MTELKDLQPLEEALGMIDQGLGGLAERQLVSTAEVTDLLLDVRALLNALDQSESVAAPAAVPDLPEGDEPAGNPAES